MKKTISYFKLCTIVLSLFITSSCDFVKVDLPNDRITANSAFAEESTATSAVVGLYGRLVALGNGFSNGRTTVFFGLSADELFTTLTTDQYLQFYNNTISIDNSLAENNFWRSAYEIIYHANLCVEELEKSSELSESLKQQLLGEAHFVRAFCYWYLVNIFGDVPLILTSDYEKNRLSERTDITIVKQQILSDLVIAMEKLSPNHLSAGKVRVNYYTVLALLSRYYLYEENWIETERLATQIIESDLYQYEGDINRIFLREGTESIWQIESSQDLANTNEGAIFIPSVLPNIRPSYPITEHLLNDFETGDLRRTSWVNSKTVQGVLYLYPFKYKIRYNANKTENYVMFRLGEVYLNRAEALAHLNRDEEALADINIIRLRANLPESTLQNTPDILETIYQERRIELFAEWGHRWFDLKRTGRINAVLGAVKSNWQPEAVLFPIPLNEILANPRLSQNDGY